MWKLFLLLSICVSIATSLPPFRTNPFLKHYVEKEYGCPCFVLYITTSEPHVKHHNNPIDRSTNHNGIEAEHNRNIPNGDEYFLDNISNNRNSGNRNSLNNQRGTYVPNKTAIQNINPINNRNTNTDISDLNGGKELSGNDNSRIDPKETPKRPTTTNQNTQPTITDNVEFDRRSSNNEDSRKESNAFQKFHSKLFNIIGPNNVNKNIIYSPLSLQTLLGFVYTGAEGNTALQLQRALELPTEKTISAELFQKILKSQQQSEDTKLVMANKMYYNGARRLKLNDKTQNLAQKYFDSDIEESDFSNQFKAARQINDWVSNKTQNRIQDLISPDSVDLNTLSILVNAIYFKAKWTFDFSTSDTTKQDFYINKADKVPVDMMFNDRTYRYAESKKLGAQILEMPYKDSDLSMMIILPNEIDGLQDVEQHLKDFDLKRLNETLKPQTVTVRMPRFNISFDTDMVEPLKMLGVEDLFTKSSDLSSLFDSSQGGTVSQIKHKAQIEVNEAGSEAAAASFIQLIPLSLPPKVIYFTVNHPFMFIIHSPEAVYFVGHVVNF